ncbi:MAG: 16S rRNA (cytosine(1402)-N(4))-methyltransferase RsmH [Verrucomicrobiales bacterium]
MLACFATFEDRPASAGRPFYHLPVLYREVAELLPAGEGRVVIDGTLGGGGHTEAFLETGARVRGIDRDAEARAHAGERLARFGERLEIVPGRFGEMAALAAERGWEAADAILLDIGVSSRQLDAAERGFSFQKDGPLDMRMGAEGPTAADLVNEWPEEELRRIFWEYGEEKSGRKVAAWIVEARKKERFERTLELADGIADLLGRRGRTHPATKVFQALRMAVNDELGELERALESAAGLLKPGGRFGVITFHSLEDRMVKRFFRETSRETVDRPEWPEARPNPRLAYRLITRKAVSARSDELKMNPRARSAKLRVVEKI